MGTDLVVTEQAVPLWLRLDEAYMYAYLRGFFAEKQVKYLFTLSGGEQIGEMVIAVSGTGEGAFIGYVTVREEHRGKGYGSEMHQIIADRLGLTLHVEGCCSLGEQHTIAKLVKTRGWKVSRHKTMTYCGGVVYSLSKPMHREYAQA
jgi:GNAT superfamily N-acetyltransferase